MPFDKLRANGVGMPLDELRVNGWCELSFPGLTGESMDAWSGPRNTQSGSTPRMAVYQLLSRPIWSVRLRGSYQPSTPTWSELDTLV